MADWMPMLVAQAWQVTLLIVAVAAINRCAGKSRPHLAHALWLVVLVKCVTPPVWSSPSGLFCWLQPVRETIRESFAVEPSTRTWDELIAAARDSENVDVVSHDDAWVESGVEPEESLLGFGEVSNPVAELPSPITTDKVDWPLMLLGVWAFASFVVIAVAVVRWLRCWRMLRNAPQRECAELSEQLDLLAKKLGLRRRVRLIVTESRLGPAVIGLFRTTVLLPALIVDRLAQRSPVAPRQESRTSLDSDSPRELASQRRDGSPVTERQGYIRQGYESLAPILAHELLHIRRGDLWFGLLQTLAQAVWWCHPLVWWVNRRTTREAERCCDEEVLAELGCDPAAYARALVDVLELKRELKPVPVFPGVRPVEVTSQRLERIMQLGQGCQRRTPWWCWLIAALAAAATWPGAAFVVTAEDAMVTTKKDLGERGGVSPPVASSQPPNWGADANPFAKPAISSGTGVNSDSVVTGEIVLEEQRIERDTTRPPASQQPSTAAPQGNSRDKSVEALGREVTVEIKDGTLNDTFDAIAKAASVEIEIDEDGLMEVGLSSETLVQISVSGIKAGSALYLVLHPLKLDYFVESGKLIVTSLARVEAHLSTQTHDLSSLLSNTIGPMDLCDFIQATIEPMSWSKAGGPASIRVDADGKRVVVRQTRRVHEEISNLFNSPRRRIYTPEEQRLLKMLSQRFSFTFENLPFKTAFSKIATTIDANVVLDEQGMSNVGVSLSHRVNLKADDEILRDILQKLCEPLGLRFAIKNEVLKITDKHRSYGSLVTGIYHVELPLGELTERIKREVHPNSWRQDGNGVSIQTHLATRSLVVRQHEDIHVEIDELVRKLSPPPVAPGSGPAAARSPRLEQPVPLPATKANVTKSQDAIPKLDSLGQLAWQHGSWFVAVLPAPGTKLIDSGELPKQFRSDGQAKVFLSKIAQGFNSKDQIVMSADEFELFVAEHGKQIRLGGGVHLNGSGFQANCDSLVLSLARGDEVAGIEPQITALLGQARLRRQVNGERTELKAEQILLYLNGTAITQIQQDGNACVVTLRDPPVRDAALIQQGRSMLAFAKPEKLISVSLENIPLKDAIKQLAQSTGRNIVLEKPGLADEGLSDRELVTLSVDQVKLSSVLTLLLEPLKLGHRVEESGVIVVTSKQRLKGEPVVVAYAVGDLTPLIPTRVTVNLTADQGVVAETSKPGELANSMKQQLQELADLIMSTCQPNSWEEVAGNGSLKVNTTTLSLVVRQTQDVHREIRDLLGELRRQLDLQAALHVETLTVPADFWSKVGKDFDDPEADAQPNPPSKDKAAPRRLARLTKKEAALLRSLSKIESAPKVTLFNGQELDIHFGGKSPMRLGLKPVVTSDRTALRVQAVAMNWNANFDLSDIAAVRLESGQSMLLDATELSPTVLGPEIPNLDRLRNPALFFQPDSAKPDHRTLLLITGQVVIVEEEQAP